MADKPIPFRPEMIRALLEGRKTMTRRILDGYCDDPPAFVEQGQIMAFDENDSLYRWPKTFAVGDRLWVQEKHQVEPSGFGPVRIFYPADDAYKDLDFTNDPDKIAQADKVWTDPEIVRQSTHMPRWASRLTLVVESVKVERLQDISEQDAIAEGIELSLPSADPSLYRDYVLGWDCDTARLSFGTLWIAIHGPGAWETNPWVAAIGFRVIKANIDEVPHE